MAVTLESASHKGNEATTSSRVSWDTHLKSEQCHGFLSNSFQRSSAEAVCIRWEQIHSLNRTKAKPSLLWHATRDSSSQCCNQLAHHNLSWNLPLASNFLPRDNNDSLQEKNEDKIDEKDKWVKRWEHFQFPIGVPDNDLGQVGLWREVLSFPVPNYLTSYPFSFIRACVFMNCLSSLLLSI